MEEVKTAIMDAIDKMHKLLNNKKGIDNNKIKIDIATANAISNLAKTYIASIVIEQRLDNSKTKNSLLLKEIE